MEEIIYEKNINNVFGSTDQGINLFQVEIARLQQGILSELEEIAIHVGKESMGHGPSGETYHYIYADKIPLVAIALDSVVYTGHGIVSLKIRDFGHAEKIAPLAELAKKYELELKKE